MKSSEILQLEKARKLADDWIRAGKRLFGKSNAPLHILALHLEYVFQRNEAALTLDEKPRPPIEPNSRGNSPVEVNSIYEHDTPSRPNAFCICRLPEAGLMIECEICHEW